MIIFKKLRWMNLLSTGNAFTEIDLIACNTTLIVGENGAGKSTILDALSFGLFGKPFRKVNKGQLINSINNKGLLVEIEFSIGNKQYVIRRGAKPTVFEIHQDGVLIDHDAASSDYQEMLDKHILKISHKTFTQIVVLGSASFVPFMQMTAAHRREVIEDLLDIQVFTIMNTLLKDKVTANKLEMVETDYMLHGTEEKIELEEQHLKELEANNDEVMRHKEQQVATLQGELDAANQRTSILQTENTTSTDSISDQSKVRARQEKVLGISRQLDSKREKTQKETEFFTTNHDCPTCRQGIEHTHRTDIVSKNNKQINEIAEAKRKITTEVGRIDAILANINKISTEIAARNQEISNLQVQVRTKQGFITSINNEIAHLKTNKQININTNRLVDLKQTLVGQIQKRELLGKDKAVLEVAGVLLKDTGIKTKIIRQYIPIINKLINKYLAAMDFFVNFELDENFEEKIKSRFRDEFSYASFSEGEKSRLDLALLFTWRSISRLRNSTSANLLLLDEVFDGSLDSQGNEELVKIIHTLTEGSNIFVISHKIDAYLDKFDRVLKFEKTKSFSRMIEL